MGYWESVLTILSAIFAMVFVLLLAYFSTKWIGNKFSVNQSSKIIKVLDRVMISQDKCLIVVRAGEKTMLVAMTDNAVVNLCELDNLEIPPTEQPEFSSILKDNFQKMMGKKESISEDK